VQPAGAAAWPEHHQPRTHTSVIDEGEKDLRKMVADPPPPPLSLHGGIDDILQKKLQGKEIEKVDFIGHFFTSFPYMTGYREGPGIFSI
jgi:hypothetical protein